MELSSSDILGLMVAARTDEATTERLQQLHEALAAIEAAKAENEKIAEACGRDKNEAARLLAVAETRHQSAASKERVTDERERAIADVHATILADKEAWEKIRQQVDAQQKSDNEELRKWEEDLSQRDLQLAVREAEISEREKAAAHTHNLAASKIAALHAVLNAS